MTNRDETLEPVLQGPWSMEDIERFLGSATVPMRLAANATSGYPVLTPLWFVWAERAIWAAVQPSTAVARALAHDSRCAFDISVETPPYRGVRGRANAEIITDGVPVLRRLLARYLGEAAPAFQRRLIAASDGEVALRLQPKSLTTWDFSTRMQA